MTQIQPDGTGGDRLRDPRQSEITFSVHIARRRAAPGMIACCKLTSSSLASERARSIAALKGRIIIDELPPQI